MHRQLVSHSTGPRTRPPTRLTRASCANTPVHLLGSHCRVPLSRVGCARGPKNCSAGLIVVERLQRIFPFHATAPTVGDAGSVVPSARCRHGPANGKSWNTPLVSSTLCQRRGLFFSLGLVNKTGLHVTCPRRHHGCSRTGKLSRVSDAKCTPLICRPPTPAAVLAPLRMQS